LGAWSAHVACLGEQAHLGLSQARVLPAQGHSLAGACPFSFFFSFVFFFSFAYLVVCLNELQN
jgi:hypothetical protein